MVHRPRFVGWIVVAMACAPLLAPADRAHAAEPKRGTLTAGRTVQWSGGPLVGTAADRFVTGGDLAEPSQLCTSASSCDRFVLDVRLGRAVAPVLISVRLTAPSQPFIEVVFPNGRHQFSAGAAFDCSSIPGGCYGSSRMRIADPPPGRWQIFVGCEACASAMYTAEAAAPVPRRSSACIPATSHRPGGRSASSSLRAVACASRIGFVSKSPMVAVDRRNNVFVYPLFNGNGLAWVGHSPDQGRRWKLISPYATGFPANVLPSDPYFYRDPKTGRLFEVDLTGAKCQALAFSDDAGRSWRTSVAGCSQFDWQTVFAGRPVSSSPTGYPNVVYTCAVNTVATLFAGHSTTCERSLDGGMTWIPTGAPAWVDNPADRDCNAGHGHGVAGPDGTIYLPRSGCGYPELAISRDEGMTWQRVRVSSMGVVLNSFGFYDPKATVDVDALGNLYFVWTARNRLPHLSISRNGGRTWSRAVAIAAPGVREASLSTVAVGGPGKIAVAYMGSTNASGPPFNEVDNCLLALPQCFENTNNSDSNQPLDMGEAGYEDTTWNGYITVSTNTLGRRPEFHSAAVNPPSDPLVRGSCAFRCRQVGDRIDVTIAPNGMPWAAFVDTCIGNCQEGAPSDGAGEGIAAYLDMRLR